MNANSDDEAQCLTYDVDRLYYLSKYLKCSLISNFLKMSVAWVFLFFVFFIRWFKIWKRFCSACSSFHAIRGITFYPFSAKLDHAFMVSTGISNFFILSDLIIATRRHQCEKKPDAFWYICRYFTYIRQRHNITSFVKRTNKPYFRLTVGD